MGLLLSLTRSFLLPSAIRKARTTYTITPLRSLADLGGVFDTPTTKCPPDRRVGGSSTCVTGGSARLPSSPSSSPYTNSNLNKDYNFPNSIITSNSTSPVCGSTPPQLQHRPLIYPLTPPSSTASLDSYVSGNSSTSSAASPMQIRTNGHGLATPPLTPDSSPTLASGSPKSGNAFEFLCKIFAHSDARRALPYVKSVEISSSELDLDVDDGEGAFTFSGIVLELPGQVRTLYIDGKGVENVQLRESIVALLDLASEHLECTALILALDRSSPALSELLHGLMYVGASVVSRPPFPVPERNSVVLVGMEI
ncbi:hypothetical protein SCHPADRAFT_899799 [Schizopora paradoxa]|uniref:Ornithine decarboxylase antizyme n=1 Tax=Schizopora paradoxa TaxID=27342 RepID=A0A0H2SMV7_9AGAM|nr:hypothetical protein SCHPADRAFT_899799 [Schizopora paradoxa]